MSKKSTRLEALHNTFKENGILPENIMVNDTLIREMCASIVAIHTEIVVSI